MDKEIERFINTINKNKGRFDRLFNDDDEVKFLAFVRNRAVPYGSFVISVPRLEGGLFWVHIKIKGLIENADQIVFNPDRKVTILTPQNKTDRNIPESLEGVPIWWLEGGKRDE